MIKVLKVLLLTILFAASPIIMDHAKDIYLSQIVAKKAHPVKIDGSIRASSWQVKYNGKRLTVTNNHVCSVMVKKEIKRDMQIALNKYLINISQGISPELALMLVTVDITALKNKEYKAEGKYLTIGSVKRKILLNSPVHDICLLEPMGDKYFSLASRVDHGERVTIIGHPRGFPQSMTDGRIIGSVEKSFRWLPEAGVVKALMSTAISYPGNSGSPVVNRYGNVVGILFAGTSVDYINVNYVVPLSAISSVLTSYTE